jgi:hypothetical protein
MRFLAKRLLRKRWSYIRRNTIGLWLGYIDWLPEDHWIRKRMRYAMVLRYFNGDVSQCRSINNEYRNF